MALHGIDGYSWTELGFIVNSITGRYDLMPAKDVGIRSFKTLSLTAQLSGSNFEDFKLKAKRLQVLFAAPGLRTVKYFDGTSEQCFAKDGFTIKKIYNVGQAFKATFEIKLIVV